jgi:type II secretory pathway pseudopilin PulG
MNTPAKIRRKLGQEPGLTLIELLVGAALTVAIALAALPVIDGANKTEGRIETAALSVGDARVFTERVGRDLRLTDYVDWATPTGLQVETYVRHTACGSDTPSAASAPPIRCSVTYSCSGSNGAGTCTRQEGLATPVTAVTGLNSSNVFSYPCPPNPVNANTGLCPINAPSDPNFVRITVALANASNAGDRDAITLQDGTALRNVG